MNNLERLFDLQARKAEAVKKQRELDAEIKALIATLPEGYNAEGDYYVDVKPNRRFDGATAKKFLDEASYNAICKQTPDSKLAQAVLTGDEYNECKKVVGVIATVKRVTE